MYIMLKNLIFLNNYKIYQCYKNTIALRTCENVIIKYPIMLENYINIVLDIVF